MSHAFGWSGCPSWRLHWHRAPRLVHGGTHGRPMSNLAAGSVNVEHDGWIELVLLLGPASLRRHFSS